MNDVHSQGFEDRTLRHVWGVGTTPARGPRPRHTLDDVADAGIALADANGVVAASLGAVATELGLTTTALYRYVDSKDSLLQVMVDRAVGPVPTLRGETWSDRVQAWTRELWTRYRMHPWIGDVLAAGEPRYPHRLAWMEVLLGDLDDGGVSDPLRIALLLDAIARSFAQLAAPPATPRSPAWLREIVSERHPRLARELEREWSDIDDELSHAVATILRGNRPS